MPGSTGGPTSHINWLSINLGCLPIPIKCKLVVRGRPPFIVHKLMLLRGGLPYLCSVSWLWEVGLLSWWNVDVRGGLPVDPGIKLYYKNDPKSGWLLHQFTQSSMHTDLDGPIVSKKLLLCQNGLQLNRKCLEFIVWCSPSPFFSAFEDLDTFSGFFWP